MDCSNLVSDNVVRMYISKFITWGEGMDPKPFTICPVNF